MSKKTKVAILFNEPVTGETDSFIDDNGQIQTGPQAYARGRLSQGGGKRSKLRPAESERPMDLSEHGVLGEMEDIQRALADLGFKALKLNVDSDVFRLIDFLREERPDVIFNLVECVENESAQEMNVAGVYELLKIPYTGAPPFTLGLALNKPLVKQILTYHNIQTPAFQVFGMKEKILLREGIRFPMIVKPSREDASVGISDDSVVYTMADLKRQVKYIHEEFAQPALVEEYVDGRELNVAILGNKRPIALPISEIDFSGLHKDMHKIVSYAAKWINGTVEFEGTKGVCPAKLSAGLESRIKDIALRCYSLIGCRDYGRVDLRLDKNGIPYVLEVNPNPDISDDAGFARAARAYGLEFPAAIARIIDSALERTR